MFTVQYRCLYRDYWYEDLDNVDWVTAVQRAQHLYTANQGRRTIRVVGVLDAQVHYLLNGSVA